MSVWTAAAGVAVGAGIAAAGWLGGQALVEARAPLREVTVKGLAEAAVEADVAAWRIAYRGEGADQAAAIVEARAARDAVRGFLTGGGIDPAQTADEPFVLKVDRVFFDNGASERVRFTAAGATRVRTEAVDAVAALSGRTLDLLDRGVKLGEADYAEAARPLYLFTGLNAVKPDLLAEATRAARASAEQFAADSGASVGAILNANQGVVQLLARDGDYPEPQERWKTVRVVTTVTYELAR
jgi:hypothetical protein